jgi:uncharacterized protein (UPF0333 family)
MIDSPADFLLTSLSVTLGLLIFSVIVVFYVYIFIFSGKDKKVAVKKEEFKDEHVIEVNLDDIDN